MSEEIKKEEVKVEVKQDDKKSDDTKTEDKTQKTDDQKSVDELKAEAEAAEAKFKAARGTENEEELKANYIRRKEKAEEKLARLKEDDDEKTTQKKGEISTRDLITLGKTDYAEDSDEAKVLQRYVEAGIVKNYAEGLTHVGVKAELEALKTSKTAKSVIDENDTEEVKLNTTKEVIANYESNGEIPTDPRMQKEIAKHNLQKMGL